MGGLKAKFPRKSLAEVEEYFRDLYNLIGFYGRLPWNPMKFVAVSRDLETYRIKLQTIWFQLDTLKQEIPTFLTEHEQQDKTERKGEDTLFDEFLKQCTACNDRYKIWRKEFLDKHRADELTCERIN